MNREEEVEGQNQGQSLAELFQKNRKKMIEKYENQKEQKEKTEVKEATKPTRTKEEMLKQRKAMMEYKAPLSQKARQQNIQGNNDNQNGITNHFGKERKSSKEPKPELLDRLALGKKVKVKFIIGIKQ